MPVGRELLITECRVTGHVPALRHALPNGLNALPSFCQRTKAPQPVYYSQLLMTPLSCGRWARIIVPEVGKPEKCQSVVCRRSG